MTVPRTEVKAPPAGLSDAMKAAFCRAWLEWEAQVEQHLGKTLAARPYRMFLFELYLAEMEQASLFQSCFAVSEAPANAHRRAVRLADLGALTRQPDRKDHRRTDLRLAPTIRTAIDHIICGAVDLEQTLRGKFPETMASPGKPDVSGRTQLLPGAIGTVIPQIMDLQKGTLLAGGFISLPSNLCRSLGLGEGDTVLMALEGDDLQIRSARRLLRLVQQRLRALAPQDQRISEQLIVERRAEVMRA